jgi:hypothetical protein
MDKQKAKDALKLAKMKERSQEYYTPEYVRKMQSAQRLITRWRAVGHVRFDKGGAMRMVPLLYFTTD